MNHEKPADNAAPPLSSLGPDERIQKILISATARFVGEFSTPDLLITHAWPASYTGRRRDWFNETSPLARTAFVLAFRTKATLKEAGIVIPNYEPAGHIVASVLSVLFGKRFDVHGPYEMSGSFVVPDLSQFSIPNNCKLPHNGQGLRADHPVSLELSNARHLAALILSDHPDGPGQAAFLGAARFYLRALQSVEDDPEVAYLHLITAGEIIANHKPFVEAEHVDADTLKALTRIETEMEGGKKVAGLLRGKVRGIKRRFVSAITSYIQADFFDRRESERAFGTFKAERFKKHVEAAYDLRSRYVHTGEPFGSWIAPGYENAEVQLGKPVVSDRAFADILYNAPTFVGLERVIRYALLGFSVELGSDLSGLKEGPTET